MTIHDRKPDSAVSKKRGPPRSELRKACDEAGISRAWAWRARQVASIPEEGFEGLIESDTPPTVTELVRTARRQHNSEPQGRRLRTCPHCGGDLTADGRSTERRTPRSGADAPSSPDSGRTGGSAPKTAREVPLETTFSGDRRNLVR